jgi:predicted dehydrogenase
MKNYIRRREFIRTAAAGGIGLGLAGKLLPINSKTDMQSGRIGIIGLDTSHSIAFTKALNDPASPPEFHGYKVVAAYPKGSIDIKSSAERIPAYTEEVKKLGVEIVDSVEKLLPKVDFILLETNDGRRHLEQASLVIKAGKRMFIDKPVAASLKDAIAIFNLARRLNVPLFSSSSLRYISGAKEIAEGSVGKVLGADTYSPATLEKTHPDLFWYGVHGVETLFTIMGSGCRSVTRTSTENTDIAVGVWTDNRVGTFRGTRSGKGGYGGTVFGENGIVTLGEYQGYNPLLVKIIEFFNTGVVPVAADETIEIFTFMEAAQVSKERGGIAVEMQEVFKKAIEEAKLL